MTRSLSILSISRVQTQFSDRLKRLVCALMFLTVSCGLVSSYAAAQGTQAVDGKVPAEWKLPHSVAAVSGASKRSSKTLTVLSMSFQAIQAVRCPTQLMSRFALS